MEKTNTKPKIWTSWTLIFAPVDQDVAGSTPGSHPKIWDFPEGKSFFCHK
jgi:hypothetical protein